MKNSGTIAMQIAVIVGHATATVKHSSMLGWKLLLPRTIINPLDADALKARGVRIRWQVPAAQDKAAPKQGTWCYAQEKHDATTIAAIKAMEREGSTLTPLDIAAASGSWARKAAETI